ncbi:MAG TPA: sensor domain-containing diguanylate cyclase [Acidimicrobiales bacterium]|nr:sensor domain-containing diguanylate cyclase [Acidimicrobiales bacterium]
MRQALRHPSRRFRYLATAAASTLAVLALLGALASALVAARSETTSELGDRFHVRVESSAEYVGSYLQSLLARTASVAGTYLDASPKGAELRLVCSVLGFDRCEVVQSGRETASWGPSRQLSAAALDEVLGDASRGRLAVSGIVDDAGAPNQFAVATRLGSPSSGRYLTATMDFDSTPLPSFLHRVVTVGHFETLLVDAEGRIVHASPALRSSPFVAFSPWLQPARSGAASVSPAGGEYASPAGEMSYASATVPGTDWRLVVAEPSALLYATAGGLQAVVPWIVLAAVAVLAGALLFLFLRSLRSKWDLQASWDLMEQEASTDPLTGLANRRLLEAALFERAHGSVPYSVLMIDLDDLKYVNDSFGHAQGDEVLCQVGDLMRSSFDDEDAVYGRWGGDEFLAVLPGAGPIDAAAASSRLQRAARELRTATPTHLPSPSLTIGTATSAPDTDVLAEADRALYEAKSSRQRCTAGLGS